MLLFGFVGILKVFISIWLFWFDSCNMMCLFFLFGVLKLVVSYSISVV